MNANKAVTATFITRVLTVTKAGNGTGTVTSAPAGINCGPTCAAKFRSGMVVTLKVTPDASSNFGGWSGACSGMGTCQLMMNANKTVNASFNQRATESAPSFQ
jgi:hypothetical protein